MSVVIVGSIALDTVQTPVVPDTYVTARPEDAIAVSGIELPAAPESVCVQLIVWAPIVTLKVFGTAGAAV